MDVNLHPYGKENLVGFYESAGFKYVRPSPVVHGKDTWHEMEQATAVPFAADE